jgi:hypothetical protein
MGGIDYGKSLRKVLLYDNFISVSEMAGYDKFRIILSKQEVSEQSYDGDVSKDLIITFKGYGNFFADIMGHQDFIFKELLTITNAEDKRAFVNHPVYDVALNIRTGYDFPHRSPVSWYARLIKDLRKSRPDLVCKIISDGNERMLGDLLQIPGVQLVHSRSAILDLLILTKAKLIIGSGGSSFTAWASYLSGAQTWIQKGRPMSYFNLYNEKGGPALFELDAPEEFTGTLPF